MPGIWNFDSSIGGLSAKGIEAFDDVCPIAFLIENKWSCVKFKTGPQALLAGIHATSGFKCRDKAEMPEDVRCCQAVLPSL